MIINHIFHAEQTILCNTIDKVWHCFHCSLLHLPSSIEQQQQSTNKNKTKQNKTKHNLANPKRLERMRFTKHTKSRRTHKQTPHTNEKREKRKKMMMSFVANSLFFNYLRAELK